MPELNDVILVTGSSGLIGSALIRAAGWLERTAAPQEEAAHVA